MRTELKLFRISQHMTQAKFADRIGVSRNTYAFIEKGKRGGNARFWDTLQHKFNLSDEKTRQLQKREGQQCEGITER